MSVRRNRWLILVGVAIMAGLVAQHTTSSRARVKWAIPTVTITSGPTDGTTSTSATFSFSTGGRVSSRTCALDGGAAVSCSSPKSYSGLAVAAHSFTVRVSNSSGSSSASYAWSITAPIPPPPPPPPPPPTTPCTLYASPSGSTSNTGTSASSPVPLDTAEQKTVPGSVVCLESGTYDRTIPLYIGRSGTASAWITYRPYDGVAKIQWTSTTADDLFQVTANTHHIEIDGLTFDGADVALQGVKCAAGAHHVRVIGNTISNTGGGGVASIQCDYLYVDHNLISHTGYGVGWASGVSLNTNVWYDTAPGFHNYVIDNVITGTDDNSVYHSDGNGIIMDLGGNTPPVLIANNVIYGNYGRCVHVFNSNNAWVVNNSCYQDSLGGLGDGEITAYNAQNVHVINDAVYAWSKGYAYRDESGSTVTYQHDTSYGGLANLVPSSVSSDPSQLRIANPLFLSPPTVDPTAMGQWATAVPAGLLGTDFYLGSGSTLVDAGIDPTQATGLTSDLQTGMATVLAKDQSGAARPAGAGYDVGAYER